MNDKEIVATVAHALIENNTEELAWLRNEVEGYKAPVIDMLVKAFERGFDIGVEMAVNDSWNEDDLAKHLDARALARGEEVPDGGRWTTDDIGRDVDASVFSEPGSNMNDDVVLKQFDKLVQGDRFLMTDSTTGDVRTIEVDDAPTPSRSNTNELMLGGHDVVTGAHWNVYGKPYTTRTLAP